MVRADGAKSLTALQNTSASITPMLKKTGPVRFARLDAISVRCLFLLYEKKGADT